MTRLRQSSRRDAVSALPIVEKLRARAREVEGDSDSPLRVAAANDLYDDAATIEALYEALVGCEAYFETLEETGDEKHPAMLKLIRGPLALARGEQP